MNISITIADTHFTAVKMDLNDPRIVDGKNVFVNAVDLGSGAHHQTRMTESEVSLVVAVMMAGEDVDLPGRMCQQAKNLTEHFGMASPIP